MGEGRLTEKLLEGGSRVPAVDVGDRERRVVLRRVLPQGVVFPPGNVDLPAWFADVLVQVNGVDPHPAAGLQRDHGGVPVPADAVGQLVRGEPCRQRRGGGRHRGPGGGRGQRDQRGQTGRRYGGKRGQLPFYSRWHQGTRGE